MVPDLIWSPRNLGLKKFGAYIKIPHGPNFLGPKCDRGPFQLQPKNRLNLFENDKKI